jgi:hypothetical protein
MVVPSDFSELEHVDELILKLETYFRAVNWQYGWLNNPGYGYASAYETVGITGTWLW